MPAFKDLSGQKFGRLTVIDRGENRGKKVMWRCRCDCGQVVSVQSSSLVEGLSQSCGCLRADWVKANMTTHGRSRSREYVIWSSMVNRCTNPAYTHYAYYGGRGITVCDAWRTFEGFFADMGEAPSPKHTLDRINGDGNYEPENCRWVTRDVQSNNKRSSLNFTIDGQTKTLTEWAKLCGLRPNLVYQRVKWGWPIERALTPPLVKKPRDKADGRFIPA